MVAPALVAELFLTRRLAKDRMLPIVPHRALPPMAEPQGDSRGWQIDGHSICGLGLNGALLDPAGVPMSISVRLGNHTLSARLLRSYHAMQEIRKATSVGSAYIP